jgi:hypothetical protein
MSDGWTNPLSKDGGWLMVLQAGDRVVVKEFHPAGGVSHLSAQVLRVTKTQVLVNCRGYGQPLRFRRDTGRFIGGYGFHGPGLLPHNEQTQPLVEETLDRDARKALRRRIIEAANNKALQELSSIELIAVAEVLEAAVQLATTKGEQP